MRRWGAVLVALALASCATRQVWEGYTESVQVVSKDGRDIEPGLRAAGLPYRCQEFSYSSYPGNKVCYVERARLERWKDLSIRFLRTPVALAQDAGVGVLIVGIAYLESIASHVQPRGPGPNQPLH